MMVENHPKIWGKQLNNMVDNERILFWKNVRKTTTNKNQNDFVQYIHSFAASCTLNVRICFPVYITLYRWSKSGLPRCIEHCDGVWL